MAASDQGADDETKGVHIAQSWRYSRAKEVFVFVFDLVRSQIM